MTKFLLLTLASAACLAQSPGIPELGWIRGQEPGRYQRVAGVAGAAQMMGQEALAAGEVLAMRPGSGMAVVVMEDGAVALARLDAANQEAALQRLPGAVEAPGVAAWSPSGDVLLLAAQQQLQVWKVEGAEAVLIREIPLAADSAAVSDGGGRILARTGGVLYAIGEEGAVAEVSRQAAGAFTFLAGGGRFAWIEGDSLRFGGGTIGPEAIELGSAQENVRRMLASAGRAKLLLVEAGENETRVRLWDSEGREEGEWVCPAAVDAVRPTGSAGVFHLAVNGAGPVWIADLGAVQPSVFFVPRSEEPQREGGDQ